MMKWVSQWAIIYMACLTDSMSTLSKVSTGKLHADRTNASYQSSHWSVKCIYCHGHSLVSNNELADALAEQASIESSLTLHPATVLAHVSKQIETTQKD